MKVVLTGCAYRKKFPGSSTVKFVERKHVIAACRQVGIDVVTSMSKAHAVVHNPKETANQGESSKLTSAKAWNLKVMTYDDLFSMLAALGLDSKYDFMDGGLLPEVTLASPVLVDTL